MTREEKLKWIEEHMKRHGMKKAVIVLLPEDWMGVVHAGDTTYSRLNMKLLSDGSYRYT